MIVHVRDYRAEGRPVTREYDDLLVAITAELPEEALVYWDRDCADVELADTVVIGLYRPGQTDRYPGLRGSSTIVFMSSGYLCWRGDGSPGWFRSPNTQNWPYYA